MLPAALANSPVFIAALMLVLAGAILIVIGLVALLRARPLRFMVRVLGGLLLIACGGIVGMLAVGLQGYQALVHEDVAARLSVQPLGSQRFNVKVVFADGREAAYQLAGDEVYVDAHILKWQPLANILGLHTVYELDRLAGRYRAIEQERTGVRTVYALAQEKPVDLFALRQRYALLAPLLDAQYGSATFVPVDRPAEFELRVSTTGLLLREAEPVRK